MNKNLHTEGDSVEENKNPAERKKNTPKVSIIFKSILGIVTLLIVFSVIVGIMGFQRSKLTINSLIKTNNRPLMLNRQKRKIVIITAEISNYFRHVSSLKSSNGFFIAA